MCLTCNSVDEEKVQCDECLSEFCKKCYIERCDIGGGQDQDVYFECPKCTSGNGFILNAQNVPLRVTDSDLLSYLLNKCDLSREAAIQKCLIFLKDKIKQIS